MRLLHLTKAKLVSRPDNNNTAVCRANRPPTNNNEPLSLLRLFSPMDSTYSGQPLDDAYHLSALDMHKWLAIDLDHGGCFIHLSHLSLDEQR